MRFGVPVPPLLLLAPLCFLPSRVAPQSPAATVTTYDTPAPAPVPGRLAPGAKIRVSFGEGAYRIRESGVFRGQALDTLIYEIPPRVTRRLPRASVTMVEVAERTSPSAGHVVRTAAVTSLGVTAVVGLTDLLLSAAYGSSGWKSRSPNYGTVALAGAATGVVVALTRGSTRWVPAAEDR